MLLDVTHGQFLEWGVPKVYWDEALGYIVKTIWIVSGAEGEGKVPAGFGGEPD